MQNTTAIGFASVIAALTTMATAQKSDIEKNGPRIEKGQMVNPAPSPVKEPSIQERTTVKVPGMPNATANPTVSGSGVGVEIKKSFP